MNNVDLYVELQKYLSGSWAIAQSDVHRDNNVGLFNTNNYTEACIKWLVPVNLAGKSITLHQLLSRLFRKIVLFERFLAENE